MKKLLLIRESDFAKYQKTSEETWDTMEFRPITQVWLQKQANWFTLKGNKKNATDYKHWQYPGEWLRRTNINKHQNNYTSWLCRWDADGVMRIRASLGQPESVMGIAILERIEAQMDDDELPEPLLEVDDVNAK